MGNEILNEYIEEYTKLRRLTSRNKMNICFKYEDENTEKKLRECGSTIYGILIGIYDGNLETKDTANKLEEEFIEFLDDNVPGIVNEESIIFSTHNREEYQRLYKIKEQARTIGDLFTKLYKVSSPVIYADKLKEAFDTENYFYKQREALYRFIKINNLDVNDLTKISNDGIYKLFMKKCKKNIIEYIKNYDGSERMNMLIFMENYKIHKTLYRNNMVYENLLTLISEYKKKYNDIDFDEFFDTINFLDSFMKRVNNNTVEREIKFADIKVGFVKKIRRIF